MSFPASVSRVACVTTIFGVSGAAVSGAATFGGEAGVTTDSAGGLEASLVAAFASAAFLLSPRENGQGMVEGRVLVSATLSMTTDCLQVSKDAYTGAGSVVKERLFCPAQNFSYRCTQQQVSILYAALHSRLVKVEDDRERV
jgi:hypothetical protein